MTLAISLLLSLSVSSYVVGSVLSPRQACTSTSLAQSFKSQEDVSAYFDEQSRTRYIDFLLAVSPDDRKRPNNAKESGLPIASCGVPNNPSIGGLSTYLCLGPTAYSAAYPVTFKDGQSYGVVNEYTQIVSNGGLPPTCPPPPTKDGIPLSAKDLAMPQFRGIVLTAPVYVHSNATFGATNPYIMGFVDDNYGFDSDGYMYKWNRSPEGDKMVFEFYNCAFPPEEGLQQYRAIVSSTDRKFYFQVDDQKKTPSDCKVTAIKLMASSKVVLPKEPPIQL